MFARNNTERYRALNYVYFRYSALRRRQRTFECLIRDAESLYGYEYICTGNMDSRMGYNARAITASV